MIAVAGTAMNLIIARYLGPESLGVFGQVLAVFTILGQVAVGGFAFGLLHLITDDPDHADPKAPGIIASTVFPVLLLSSLVALATAAFAVLSYGRVFSEATSFGLLLVAPGVVLFAINKCLMYAANAQRRMIYFAIAQGGRLVGYLVITALIVVLDVDPLYLPAVFPLGELMLLAGQASNFGCGRWWSAAQIERRWVGRVLRHGRDAYLVGLLADINVRIDIVVLGLLVGDAKAGLYVFMAMFAEGLAQLPIAVQHNTNPLLSRLGATGRISTLPRYVWQISRWLVPLVAGASVIATLVLPFAADLLTGRPEYGASWEIFAVLAGGVTIASAAIPFQMLLNQLGRPGLQSLMLSTVVLANVVLNFTLIPTLGLLGAAIATAIASVLTVPLVAMSYAICRQSPETR